MKEMREGRSLMSLRSIRENVMAKMTAADEEKEMEKPTPESLENYRLRMWKKTGRLIGVRRLQSLIELEEKRDCD